MKLYIDIETYSATDLKAGVYRYVEDPAFQILMAAWAIDDGPITVALGSEQILKIPGLWDADVTKVAHNAQFERVCFSRFQYLLGYRLQWPTFIPPEQYHDTMAVAGVKGYPQSLRNLAKSLDAEDKDEAGTTLVTFFCKPNPRKRERNLPEDHPQKWLEFILYCEQDVATLRDVDQRLGGFPTEMERDIYLADQIINDRGIPVDVNLARKAVSVAAANQEIQVAEIKEISGVDNPGSLPQMLGWLRGTGLTVPNLQKETVEKLLSSLLPDDTRRVLELRQELALVASKKFQAALDGVGADGRLRGQFRYFGAHTGRWTGRGVQLQNLPRASLKSETEAEAVILDIHLGLGADAATLKKLVRPMFVGPFTVVDYSAIEARVIAWLASEQWALKAFAEGRDIYVETANRMSTPDNRLNRSQGKVAVLALGYNGGIGSLRAMGASGSDEELQSLVHQWRRANPRIVGLWNLLDESFYRGGEAGLLRVTGSNKERRVELPSGRSIAYHNVSFKVDPQGRRRATFWSPQGFRTDTYGGRLAENATQAVARDILAEALVRLRREGYPVVGHVHDEILVSGDDEVAVREIMTQSPAWAAGMPIDGAGFVCKRYRKG